MVSREVKLVIKELSQILIAKLILKIPKKKWVTYLFIMEMLKKVH